MIDYNKRLVEVDEVLKTKTPKKRIDFRSFWTL